MGTMSDFEIGKPNATKKKTMITIDRVYVGDDGLIDEMSIHFSTYRCNGSMWLHSYRESNKAYEKGIAYSIDLVEQLKVRYESFKHEEYYVSAMISDLEDLIEQLKEQGNERL